MMIERKEQINAAAINYKNQFPPDYIDERTYIAGAEWADENPKKLILSAADRGMIDEIIKALEYLEEDKMLSFSKEIDWLMKVRKL